MAVVSCKYERDAPCEVDYDEAGRGSYVVRYRAEADSVMSPGAVLAGARPFGWQQ